MQENFCSRLKLKKINKRSDKKKVMQRFCTQLTTHGLYFMLQENKKYERA